MTSIAIQILTLSSLTAWAAEAAALPHQNDTKLEYTVRDDMRFPVDSKEPLARGMVVDRKWPHGIVPYVINSKFTAGDRAIIMKGLNEIGRRTCVRFRPWTNQATRLEIIAGNGCWSFVGFSPGWKSLQLSLAIPDCLTHTVVIHELMHALGFVHEQERPDRDYNVVVLLDNARPQENELMKNHDVVSLGVPYNVASVMHYGPFDLSAKGEPVLVSTRTHHPVTNVRVVPESDFRQINRLYGCPASFEALLDHEEYGEPFEPL